MKKFLLLLCFVPVTAFATLPPMKCFLALNELISNRVDADRITSIDFQKHADGVLMFVRTETAGEDQMSPEGRWVLESTPGGFAMPLFSQIPNFDPEKVEITSLRKHVKNSFFSELPFYSKDGKLLFFVKQNGLVDPDLQNDAFLLVSYGDQKRLVIYTEHSRNFSVFDLSPGSLSTQDPVHVSLTRRSDPETRRYDAEHFRRKTAAQEGLHKFGGGSSAPYLIRDEDLSNYDAETFSEVKDALQHLNLWVDEANLSEDSLASKIRKYLFSVAGEDIAEDDEHE